MAKQKDFIKVTFLGGVGEIGKNMTVLEYGNDMIIVDCGVEFPKNECPGIEAIIPDISYVRENLAKLKGIVLTHGHEDHMGAIPYYLETFRDVPIYGTALTIGLLARKLEKDAKKLHLVTVKEGDTVHLGGFDVEFIKVTHSMAGACAFSIDCGAGRVFVSGDFKLDPSPIDNKKTNLARIEQIGKQGVLLMLGESTNVERKGHSTSEKVVGKNLERIFVQNADKRIVIACFASSNYRVQQVVNLAHKFNRKVVLAGKSMKGVVEVASSCGELKLPKGIIADNVSKLNPSETVVLATGSQGEPLSALHKMSKGEFNKIDIGEDDVVVLSSSPIPGNEKSVYDVINDLYRKGASVIYDAMNDIHASGHAYEDELKTLLSLVKPKCFMPVHGEYRHQVKHAQLAKEIGVKQQNIIIANNGESYGINEKGVRQHSNVACGNIYVDGEVLEDGQNIVQDRLSLAQYGMLMVLCAVDVHTKRVIGDVDVVSRGVNITKTRMHEIENTTLDVVAHADTTDVNEMARAVKKSVRKLFYKDRKFPIIIPVIVED